MTRDWSDVAHARWWYITLYNCVGTGIRASYNMSMTNGESFFDKHFSAEKQGKYAYWMIDQINTAIDMLTPLRFTAFL